MRVAQLPPEPHRGEVDFVTQEGILFDEIVELPETDGIAAQFEGNGQPGEAMGDDKNLTADAVEELSPAK